MVMSSPTKRSPIDSTDRLEALLKVHASGRRKDAAEMADERGVTELEELADLAAKGVIRDLEIDGEIILRVTCLVSDYLRSALSNDPETVGKPTPLSGVKAMPLTGKASTKGGFVKTAAGTPTTVAPWMANPGAAAPKPLKRPMGAMNCCPPPGGGLASQPMTVLPGFMPPPGSTAGKVLGVVAAGAGGGERSIKVRGATASCTLAGKMMSIEESAEAASSLGDAQLRSVAEMACTAVDQLCSIGAGVMGAGRLLSDEACVSVAASLKALVSSVYLRFASLRACLRRRLALSLSSWVSKCAHVSRQQLGVRLHALDGGPKASPITLVGISASLELLAGMVKGLRKPPKRHMHMLWDCLMPIHSSNSMVDDVTPLLSLIHKPLCHCLVAFLEADPTCAANLLRILVSYWPPVSSSNSSKEVLLLHELELLLDHCRPEALEDCQLRDLISDLIISSFEGTKNFRVAQRCLLLFKADGVVSLLRHHQAALVPKMVPKLLTAASTHWNATVLRMVGNALQVLQEMDEDAFLQLLGPERVANVQEAVLKLCPPEDKAKMEEDAAARVGAMQARRDAGKMDLYCLAMGHELGDGAYSRVRYAKLIAKDLPQSLWPQVAVKIMDKKLVKSQNYEANVAREIRVLNLLMHPAVVRFVGSFETETSIYIALEYMASGDLQQALAQKGSLSVKASRFITAEIITGLQHMHSQGVVYGDLKPENVLLDAKNHCKLSDFGSCRIVSEAGGQEEELHRVEGTLDYISPEVAAGLTSSSFESDAWALGCVLFQLVAGHVPVPPEESGRADNKEEEDQEEGNKRALRHIVRFTETKQHAGMFDEDFPEEPRGLLCRLLSVDAATRLGGSKGLWGDVMEDVLFEGIEWERLPECEPPLLNTGMVSAQTASDKRWNRRKQSMMFAPMPDKYVGGGGGDVSVLPEEEETSNQVIMPEQGPGSGEFDANEAIRGSADAGAGVDADASGNSSLGPLASMASSLATPQGLSSIGKPPVPTFGGGKPPAHHAPMRPPLVPQSGQSDQGAMVIESIAEESGA